MTDGHAGTAMAWWRGACPGGDAVRAGRLALVAAGLVLGCVPAHAQWDPGATQQLGMGHGQNAMSQSALRHAAARGAHDGKPIRGYAGSGMSRRERLLALEAEYLERVERDGADSANAWAFERGRQDARAR